ncbi:MAG: methyl-accepting chemotaxis protein [Clostridium sp.]
MKSLKKKLILGFSLSMSIILTFTSIMTFNLTKNKLKTQLQTNEMAVAEQISNNIDKSMNEVKSIGSCISLINKNLNYTKDNHITLKKHLEISLSEILVSNDDLETVYTFFRPDMQINNEMPYECILRDENKNALAFQPTNINEFKYWEQNWYETAKSNENFVWTEPYLEDATGRKLISGVQKMVNPKGEFIGVSGIDVNMDRIENIMTNFKLEEGAFCFIVSQDGTYIYHPNKDYILTKNISFNGDPLSVLTNELKDDDKGFNNLVVDNKEYSVFTQNIPSTGWDLGVAYPVELITNELYALLFTDIICLFIGIILTVATSILISKNILKNISKGVELSNAVSKGDLTYNVSLKSNDEISILINAMDQSSKSIKNILGNLNDDIVNLNEIVNQLQNSGKDIFTASNDITSQIKNVQADITDQNKNISEIYNNFDEIDGFMANIYTLSEENLNRTIQSVNVINSTKEITETSIRELTNVVNLTKFAVDSINKLEKRTKQIENTLKSIQNISKRTKLLSLNASIEANSAGEAGKGFNVVAQEIKNFSQETEIVVQNIEALINEIIKESNDAAKFMNMDIHNSLQELTKIKDSQSALNDIAKNLSDFEDFAKKLNNLIEFQKTSSNVIKTSLKDIELSSSKIESSINDILDYNMKHEDTVNVLNKSSKSLNTITKSLKNLISKFKM